MNIEILEKEKEARSMNAFGLGIGTRMQHRLSDVPGLKEKLLESTVCISCVFLHGCFYVTRTVSGYAPFSCL